MLDETSPCVGNTWLVETGSLDESYSDDLASLLIRMSDLLPGSSVFDPFMGNSAILKACLTMGHSLTGFETDKRKIKQYQKIIEDFKRKEQDAVR
jgi:tRNA G10  N-methylase Trm11